MGMMLAAPGRGLRTHSHRRPHFIFYRLYAACLMGANAVILMPPRNFGASGTNTWFTVSWLLLAAMVLMLTLVNIRRNATSLIIAMCFSLYVLSSALWSPASTETLTYGALLAANIFAAHLMASDLELSEIVAVIGSTALILCVIGLIAYHLGVTQAFYFDPHGRPNIFGGQPYRGLFVHKITAGLYASLGTVWAMSYLRGIRRIVALGVFAYCVALTSSSTGVILLSGAVMLTIAILYVASRRVSRPSFFLLATTTSVVALSGIAAYWSDLLGALGRDETLTGRTTLWSLGIDTWSARPIFGWGFAGYFNSPNALALRQQAAEFQNYDIPHFHQSYIQTAVDLGLTGVITLVFLVAFVLWRSYARIVIDGERAGVATFAMTGVLVVASMVMYTFVTYNSMATFALLVFFFALRQRPVARQDGATPLRQP
jgi:O-antigen ligase